MVYREAAFNFLILFICILFTLDKQHFSWFICKSTYIFWYLSQFSFQNVFFHSDLHHKHSRSTFSALTERKHAFLPHLHEVISKFAALLQSFSPCFIYTIVQIFRQVDRGCEKVEAGERQGESVLQGASQICQKQQEKQPGGRRSLMQMTNVRWAFPIPLLSARANASYCECVCGMIQCCRSIK